MTKVLSWSLVLITSQKCIHAFPYNVARPIGMGKPLGMGEDEGDKGDTSGYEPHMVPDGVPTTAKNLKRRSLDFPPALYDILLAQKMQKGQKASNLKVSPGSKSPQQQVSKNDAERLHNSNRTVSIPSNREFAPKERNFFATGGIMDIFNGDVMDIVNNAAYRTRLLNERFYANKESFETKNLMTPPGLRDLASINPEKDTWQDKFWIGVPARLLTFGVSCFIFPYIVTLLDQFVTMPPDQLDDIVDQLGPGITILYGTFSSLTVSILYQRIKAIQEYVATECALLVLLLRSSLSLFSKHPNLAVEAGQAVADQIRTLVKSSRGVELMEIIYTDPYGRIWELVDNFENQIPEKELLRKQSAIVSCRDLIKDIIKCRSTRLTEESRALPPTHFLILNSLTSLIQLGYCVSVLPTLDRIGSPSNESTLIFGILSTVYVLFYNFSYDLNNPFKGVYQVRRSTGASQLLEAKWLIANHPLLKGQVDFEEAKVGSGDVLVRTPGLGEYLFGKDELYVENGNTDEEAEF